MHTLASLMAAGLLAANPAPRSDILPLKKLRLYETGVGYFERDGVVSNKHHTSLPLPASHLDDALKTMVVLSRGQHVQVGGIEFASSVSEGMGRAIAGLPQTEEEGELSYQDLLSSLEGIFVEVEIGRERVRGTLVEVLGPFRQGANTIDEPSLAASEADTDPPAAAEYPTEPEYTLLLRTERGQLRRVKTSELRSLRPTEESANARIEVALAALSSRSPQTEHPLRVQISGSGPLKLGYIAETPVWRTTYRVVLGEIPTQATLQAWALIHNDTDEDWDDLAVELVNGRPTSFLFPLAAPRYARRELAEPEVALSTVPQLLNTSADRLWGDFFDVEGLGLVGTGSGGGGHGEGAIGLGSIGTIGHAGGMGTSGPQLGDLAEFAQATGEESGALFSYRLPSVIDLSAHHSALVPVVQHTIEAEAITWFDADSDEALMAARVVNRTSQTLPAGTVAFFDSTGFLGESGFERLRPEQQTFAVHGNDLDVDLGRRKRATSEQLHDVRFSEDQLHESLVVRGELEIELRNRSGRERTVYVGLPIGRNARIEGHDQLDYDHARGLPLAEFQVAAGTTATTTLQTTETSARRSGIDELTAARLTAMAAVATLTVDKREALDAAAKLLRELEGGRSRRGERMTRITRLETEVERLREDLRALGSAGLKDRAARTISQRVVELEKELVRLREANESARRQEERLMAALREQLSLL